MTSPYVIYENQIHVWSSDLAKQGQYSLRGYLSESETTRAEKFRFQKDRTHYEKARGMLRVLLGHYFTAPPEKIEIPTTEFGKPYVPELLNGRKLCFNLSHSGGLAVYAFCLNCPVGVDVEVLRPIPDLDQLAARFYTAGEQNRLQSLTPPSRLKSFLHYWTRKEAYLKAIGLGLSISPEEVDVSSPPIPSPQLIAFHPRIKSDQNTWSLMDFFPTHESVSAVVVDTSITQIELRHCEKL